jgi:hypothetical protein
VSAPDPVPGGPLDGVESIACPHPGAVVLGHVGVTKNGREGLPVTVSQNVPAELAAAVANLRADLSIGQCPECTALVVTVHTVDTGRPAPRGPEDRPRSASTPWVTLS